MIWLGRTRGQLTDWVTQRWVQLTGRRVDLARDPWLAGPVGKTSGVGKEFFAELARQEGLVLRGDGVRGLVAGFAPLAAPDFDPARLQPAVVEFYTHTSAFELDAWAEWCGVFRPFGWMLARLFSRRLQQLNMPLSALDTSRGVESDVLQLVERSSGVVRYTAWVRELVGTRNVLYAGSYSYTAVPNQQGSCVKVVFPLPNGNATVIMRPEVREDGSLVLHSTGRGFGDPGFYFTVHGANGRVWARYLAAMKETIHVYAAPDGVRADHTLTLWGATFLRLHYRLRRTVALVPGDGG